MISFLKGEVIAKSPTEVTLLTHGVGYQLFISTSTAQKLQLNQKDAQLHIYTHVRQDTLSLFGFASQNDKENFKLLISVSGIGPKIALAIGSVASSKSIERAVLNADVDFFSRVPGIGKKSAQRIIVDLKSKIGTLKELDLSEKTAQEYLQVKIALRGLGFSSQEAIDAIKKVKNKTKLSEEDIIRQALKNLAKT